MKLRPTMVEIGSQGHVFGKERETMGDDKRNESSNGARSANSTATKRYNELANSSKTWNKKVERTVEKARRAGRRRSPAA